MRTPLLAILALGAFAVTTGTAKAPAAPPLAWPRVLRRGAASAGALWAIPPIAAVAGCRSLAHADPGRIGDLGLIGAIPATVLAMLAPLALGFAAALRERRLRPPLLAAYLLALLLLLHGAPALVEQEPRFATAWLHAGFADYIAHTGSTLPGLDARFNWPGFFAAAALLMRGLGIEDPRPVLAWAPLAFGLLALVPVYAIAALTSDDARVPWLATWLFIPANWVGQDYFSPQALAFALFLGFAVVLLRYFPRSLPAARRGVSPAPPWGALLAILLLLYCAIVWSHQLTPYFAIAASAGLVLAGACRLRTLPLLLAAIAVAFVSYLAVPYWSGHLRDIFGGVGQLGATVSSNVGNRTAASGPHEWVPRVRIATTGCVWGLALLGAAVRWLRGKPSLALLVLLAAPFSVVGLQSYGGEVLLRVYLFALPFAAALMAAAALPLVSLLLLAGFYVARFGNEIFEQVRPGELAAIQRLYRIAPRGSTFVSLDGNVPWRYTQIADHPSETPLPIGRSSPAVYVVRLRDAVASNPAGAYLLVTRAQLASERIVAGVPAAWFGALDRQLARGRGIRLVYASRDARIYRLSAARKGRA